MCVCVCVCVCLCICWCVTEINYKMRSATIKIPLFRLLVYCSTLKMVVVGFFETSVSLTTATE